MTKHEIRTAIGRAAAGDYDHFGLSVHRDLVATTSYLGLVAFSVMGRRLSPEQERVLDDLAVAAHTPEPRIFPIKLTWVVGCLGRAAPGFASGSIVCDSDLLGGRVGEDAALLLLALEARLRAADTDETIEKFVSAHGKMFGFGVPFRDIDERIVAFKSAVVKRQHAMGRYWQIAERLWRVAAARRIKANIVSAMAAVCLDLGFRPEEIPAMALVLLQPTLLANAVEASFKRPDVLRRLPPALVRYEGPRARKSPRSEPR